MHFPTFAGMVRWTAKYTRMSAESSMVKHMNVVLVKFPLFAII